ncbi:MAG: ComF family protein [Firmicutes bacterium]|nr:ComF family protein [Bacillota bacterium]
MKSDKEESVYTNGTEHAKSTKSNRIEKSIAVLSDRILRIAAVAAASITSIVFPQSLYCICCGNIIDSTRSYSLCDHCMEHIRWNVDEPKVIDEMRVMRCVDYGIYERSIIFAFKYDGHRYIARDIASIMADRLRSLEDDAIDVGGDNAIDSDCKSKNKNNGKSQSRDSDEFADAHKKCLIVPVPLHDNKYFARGFNQSELIGKYLAEKMGWDMADVLIRTKETKAMRGLGPAERADTIRGSIKLAKEGIDLIRNKDIMLVDDFYTTGSTARECKRALESANPKSISLIAFAGREWSRTKA